MSYPYPHMRIQFLLLCIIASYSALAQSSVFSTGDTLYVWAINGMILRASPDFKGEAISKVLYGQQVVMQATTQDRLSYELMPQATYNKQELPTIWVSENFIQVTFSGKTGYLYGGLLSRLKPAIAGEGIEKYFERAFGRLKVISEDTRSPENMFKRIIYQNGATLQHQTQNGNSWTYLYLIPEITVREGYLMLNVVLEFEKNYANGLANIRDGLEMYPKVITPDHIELATSIFEDTVITSYHRYTIITRAGGN